MKTYYKKHPTICLLLGLTVLSLVIFSPYLLNIKEFVFDTDQWIEYRFMYEQWDRMIDLFLKKGVMPFYSFNSFLGNDFFSSKAFYITGDFFFPIIRLFPNIVDGLKFETIICFIVSGYSFSLWIKAFGIKQLKYIHLGAYVYALTGMASIFCGVYMFYRFYCFLPFIFYAIECYRQKHKYWVFPLAIAQGWLSCFYLMIPTSLFMAIYFIFTYSYHEDIKFINIIYKAIPAIGLYIMGLFMSSVLTVPALINTLTNPRVGNGDAKWYIPFDHHVMASALTGLVTPSINVSSRIPYLFESGFDGHLSRFTTFVNPLILIALIATITTKTKDKQIKTIQLTTLTFMLVMFIKPINMVFHGLSEPSMRYIFIPTSIMLIMALALFDSNKINNNRLPQVTKFYTLLCILTLLIILLVDKVNVIKHSFHITLILSSLLLLYILVKYYCKHGFNSILLISLIFINVVSFSGRLLNMSSTYYSYTDSLNKAVMEYNASYDPDKFFRIWVDPSKLMPTSPMNLNQSLHFNYRSTASYDSCYEQNLNDFLSLNNIDWNRLCISNPQTLRMLGVKYWYVTDESELPAEFEFTYVTNVNHYKVYLLNNYRPIGFTYTKYTQEKNPTISWNDTLIIEEDLANLVTSSETNESVDLHLVDYRNDNYLYGEISLDKQSVLFTSIPYNPGWLVLDQDKELQTYKVQGGFIGLNLEPGDHYLTFIYVPPGYSLGNKLTLIGISTFILLCVTSVFYKKKVI